MFLHFLHDQLLTLYGIEFRGRGRSRTLNAMRNALYWATYLATEPLVMPTSDVVQSPMSTVLGPQLRTLAAADELYFVGSSIDIDDLQRQKSDHFGDTGLHPEWAGAVAQRRLHALRPSLQVRELNTTSDIKDRWVADVSALAGGSGSQRRSGVQLLQARQMLAQRTSPTDFETALVSIPDRLDRHAFLWHVVEQLGLFPYETSPSARQRFAMVLGWHWACSYLEEYGTTMVGRIPGVGYVDCGVLRTHPAAVVDLVSYERALATLGLHKAFHCLDLREILRLKHDPAAKLFRDTILTPLCRAAARPPSGQPGELRDLARLVPGIRGAAGTAATPFAAMTRAAEFAVAVAGGPATPAGAVLRGSARPDRRDQPPSATTGIAVVLALAEEFGYLMDRIETAAGATTAVDDAATGRVYHRVQHRTDRGVETELTFVLVGRGPERAAALTSAVIGQLQPAIVVNVGIAGGLSEDVSIGDVIVGDQVVSYLANAKAREDGERGYSFSLAGEPFRSDELLVDRAGQLPFIAPAKLAQWRQRRLAGLDPRLAAQVGEPPLKILSGPIACGPVVAAASPFKAWLRQHKRDYLAVDMESSGVAQAVHISSTVRRVRLLVIRGISDQADEHKPTLETETGAAARRLAAEAAVEVLLMLLDVLPEEVLG